MLPEVDSEKTTKALHVDCGFENHEQRCPSSRLPKPSRTHDHTAYCLSLLHDLPRTLLHQILIQTGFSGITDITLTVTDYNCSDLSFPGLIELHLKENKTPIENVRHKIIRTFIGLIGKTIFFTHYVKANKMFLKIYVSYISSKILF